MKKTAFAPGKAIIIGDHTIVHGGKGYVVPLAKGVYVSLSEGSGKIATNNDLFEVTEFIQQQLSWFSANVFPVDVKKISIEIDFQIPTSAGLGSSTAVTAALFSALCIWYEVSFTNQNLYEYVLAAESASYSVSGIDQSCIAFNTPFFVKKNKDASLVFDDAPFATELQKMVLVATGSASESTAEMVAISSKYFAENQQTYRQMLDTADQFVRNLRQDVFSFELLQEFGDYLFEVGVVGKKAQSMINQIKEVGGGAKVTAGGGVQTGSGMILAWHQDFKVLTTFLKNKRWNYFPVTT
jgi:mevalonate kinase